jgi:RNA recognition motif-containing protein
LFDHTCCIKKRFEIHISTLSGSHTSLAMLGMNQTNPADGGNVDSQQYQFSVDNNNAGGEGNEEEYADYSGTDNNGDEGLKLFIGQIPRHMDEDTLRPYFVEFGHILELTVIRDKSTKMHRGCAFLTYARKQSAANAIEALHDVIKLPNAVNPLQIRPAESQAERENKIFVGMLPKTITEIILHDMFARFGQLKEIHIIRGPEGHSKGCAFVKFMDRDAAVLAIHEMHDSVPEGSTRPLVIKFADSKKGNQKGGQDGYDDETGEYSHGMGGGGPYMQQQYGHHGGQHHQMHMSHGGGGNHHGNFMHHDQGMISMYHQQQHQAPPSPMGSPVQHHGHGQVLFYPSHNPATGIQQQYYMGQQQQQQQLYDPSRSGPSGSSGKRRSGGEGGGANKDSSDQERLNETGGGGGVPPSSEEGWVDESSERFRGGGGEEDMHGGAQGGV